ncbi:hypothetical protein AAP_04909 [Ascosphaera apis ARSEF 7405]|uniref:Uncharacterized protein n=1 Tax=Ascosphaera apis ARSEF 7405 TaxID=392613 RepID=A0A167WA80_9EURO|nr:hypothetical protein AAP_04909 [Ascosphaera apis ARSEF 7405]
MALSHSRSEFRKELLDSCKPLLDNDNKIHLIPSTSLSSDNFSKYYDTDTGTHNNPSSRLVSIDMMGCSVDRLASVLDLVVRHDESNTTWEALYDAIVLIFDTAETPLARASSIIDREAQKASQSAFWKADRFQNSRSPSSFLLQKLRDYYSIYAHDRNYVAPYASLVGPSGIGKSFAIKEMAT